MFVDFEMVDLALFVFGFCSLFGYRNSGKNLELSTDVVWQV